MKIHIYTDTVSFIDQGVAPQYRPIAEDYFSTKAHVIEI